MVFELFALLLIAIWQYNNRLTKHRKRFARKHKRFTLGPHANNRIFVAKCMVYYTFMTGSRDVIWIYNIWKSKTLECNFYLHSATISKPDHSDNLLSKLHRSSIDQEGNGDEDDEAEISEYLTLAQLGSILRELTMKGKISAWKLIAALKPWLHWFSSSWFWFFFFQVKKQSLVNFQHFWKEEDPILCLFPKVGCHRQKLILWTNQYFEKSGCF